MIKIKYILAVMAMLILSAVPALAVEGVEGSVTGGFEFFSGDFNNAKFNEYRVRRESPWGGFAEVEANYAKPDGNHEYNLCLKYRSLEDIDMHFDTMSYGEYKFFVNYQRMGHTFATNVHTVYSGDGTGNLTIPASTLATVNPSDTFTLPGSALALKDAVADAHTIDLFLIRDRVKTGLDWMSFKPLTLYALFDYEHREGDRPYGATFGTDNGIEIPEPIDYDTYNAKAGVEYAGQMYANASYNHSTFNNNIQSVTYDNIKEGIGVPTRGRSSLAPSNEFDSVSVVLAKNLPLATRLIFNFNYGWLRQDEGLLPPTINSGLAPYNTTAVLPRDTADASVNTTTYDVKLTSSPIDKLELKAGYRYYQHDNRTAAALFPTSFTDTADDTLEADPSEYVSWVSRTVNAEASYELVRRTHIGFAWENMNTLYRNGIQNEESENSYKLYADSRFLDYLTARLTLEYKNRDALYKLESTTTPRAFYAADRDRYIANALVTVMPMDSLTVSVDYSYEDTRYANTDYGLNNVRGHVAGLDAEYQPAWWLGMNLYYTYENQRDRQKNPRSGANWGIKTTDETNTVGGGVDVGIIKDKLNLKVDGSYAKVDGDAAFTRNTPLLPFDHVDETMLTKLGATFKYQAMKALELSLGYGYEKWDIKDYQYDGVTTVVVDPGSRTLLDMNTLYKPYEVHSVIASATYKF